MNQYRNENQQALWIDYTRRKREWEQSNPGFTGKQHTAAMRRIADSLGV